MSNRIIYLKREPRKASAGEILAAFMLMGSIVAFCWAFYFMTGHVVRF